MAATPSRSTRIADHRYYYGVGILFLLTVLAGFAKTYYLKSIFEPEPLTALLHLHGLVMTLWYVLFLVQVRLVATHRVALHRRLGFAGVLLAAMAAVMATTVSLGLARRRLQLHADSSAAPMLLGIQLFGVVLVFMILMGLGIYWRKRPDYHKRFMTLAMLSVLGPAITRLPLPFIANHDVTVAIALSIGFVVVCVLVDTTIHRRLHPVFGYGGGFVIGSIFAAAAVSQSAAWIRLTKELLQ